LNSGANFIDKKLIIEFIKSLYCPKSLNSAWLSYAEVRQLTIKPPKQGKQREKKMTFTFIEGQVDLRNPRLWLLPAQCLD
jgi:hypothetical protein